MAISTLTSTFQVSFTWNAQDNLTGSDYPPVSQSTSLRKSRNYGTAANNTSLGGANQLVSYIVSLANSANTTVDLTSLTNILQTSVALARVKGFMMRLLSTTDDSVLGTTCTSITVGNAATNTFKFNNLSTNATQDIFLGGVLAYFDQQAAGFTVNTTLRNVKIVNNDATNTAKIQISLVGGDS